MANEARLKRKELYDLVWSKSMVQLAKEFNLSDVGLAKICKKHDIPRPGPGYWAKRDHGKPVTKAPLPKDAELDKETIIINPKSPTVLAQQGKRRGIHLKKEITLTTQLDDPSKLHPLIRKAYKTGFQETLEKGFFALKKSPLRIRVGQNSQDRVLCLLDTLFKAIESRGHAVKTLSEKRRYSDLEREAVVIEVKGERIHFYLREKNNQVDHVLTKEEKEHEKRWGYRSAPKFDYVPSGKLEFVIDADIYNKPRWQDAETIKLENKMGQLLKGILKAADHFKKRRIRQKECEIRRAIEEKKRWAEEQKRRDEEKRIQNLEIQVENWRKSRHIRNYLKAAVDLIVDKHGGYDEDSEFGLWLRWAHGYANKIDPLSE